MLTVWLVVLTWIWLGVAGAATSSELVEADDGHSESRLYVDEGHRYLADRRSADLGAVEHLRPIKQGDHIMYWRPQKVGSSTLLSILMSYSYRYNFLPRRKSSSNAACARLAECALAHDQRNLTRLQAAFLTKMVTRSKMKSTSRAREQARQEEHARRIPFKIVLTHEMCNVHSDIVRRNLPCVFDSAWEDDPSASPVLPAVREIFQVRDPVARAISAYYFWGELYKMIQARRQKGKRQGVDKARHAPAGTVILGALSSAEPVEGGLFIYHGDEKTVPPRSFAMDYVRDLPLMAGMPGPSYTWSAFANSAQLAIKRLTFGLNDSALIAHHHVVHPALTNASLTGRAALGDLPMMTIVLERLEESLVALRYHLGWSLADVIYVKQRKALSSHPKARDWPAGAVALLRQKLEANGEYAVYNASAQALDARLHFLESVFRVNVSDEVRQFRILRSRVSALCLDDAHLQHYKRMMDAAQLPPHPSDNKLRDVESKYAEQGHVYSFNREILCSFDVCGGCEAHAMLLGWQRGLAPDLESAPALRELPPALRENNVNFAHCPSFQRVA